MISTTKKLWPELKPHRNKLILVLILGAVTSGLKALAPELLNRLVTAWQPEHHDLNAAIYIPISLALIWVLSSIARYFHLYLMKYTADRISVGQRRKLMDKYLSLNLSFFQNFESGSGGLISRMVNDISVILGGIHKIADAMREPILIVGMFTYLMFKEWRLTLFVILVLPIVIAVLRRIARSLRKYAKQNQEIMERLTRTLKESLDGTRIVQSFVLENQMRNKFNTQADEFLSTRSKIISREEAAGPISESLNAIFFAILLVIIGLVITKTKFTTADFIGYVAAMGLLQDSIRKLQDAYVKMQQAGVAIERLQTILDSQPMVRDPESPIAFPTDWQEIEFRNVSFAFKDDLVLKNINLKINRSETLALVGTSGSGKSTLVNLLQRFFDPTEGEILIGGVPIRNMRLADLRRHIALVTQDVFLFNDSIEQNIQMGNLQASKEKIEASAKLANAHDFIINTPESYKTSVGDFGSRMSGGEKQRISIARAILKDAPILVLDEATSALDSESEQEVQKGLTHLLQGRTAFVIAHRLSTIANADRIVVLKKGQIVEVGSHSQLIDSKGEYFKFHQMQSVI